LWDLGVVVGERKVVDLLGLLANVGLSERSTPDTSTRDIPDA
jgi:hypothetical protein